MRRTQPDRMPWTLNMTPPVLEMFRQKTGADDFEVKYDSVAPAGVLGVTFEDVTSSSMTVVGAVCADAGQGRIPPRQFYRNLRAVAGCDDLQRRLRGSRRRLRPRHLGVPAGATPRRQHRRGQYRLRPEHDAGSQPAGPQY